MVKAFRRILLVAAAVVFASLAPSAFADSTVYFNGSYAFANYGYGIPPYGGTLDGKSAQFYCVDFTHDISAGQQWQAIVTPLPSIGSSTAPYLAGQTIDGVSDYLLFAWLIGQMNPGNQAQYQWAIWSVTDGGYDPYGNPSSIFSNAAAQLTAADFTGQGWEILTPDARLNQCGQEFLVRTPEPASVLLLALGLATLFFFKRRRAFQN